MSIADISYFSSYEEAYLVDVDLAREFLVVERWLDRMKEGSKGREMIKPNKIWEREESQHRSSSYTDLPGLR